MLNIVCFQVEREKDVNCAGNTVKSIARKYQKSQVSHFSRFSRIGSLIAIASLVMTVYFGKR